MFLQTVFYGEIPFAHNPRVVQRDCAGVLCRGLGTSIVEQTVENAKALPVFGTCSIVVADAPVEQGPFWQKLQFVACALPLFSPFPHSPRERACAKVVWKMVS